jgi:microsomal epoxide hydrolase
MMPAEIWDLQVRHFAKSYHVVALDPRSQGESERPTEGHYPERRARDIRKLIEHLKLSNVVLVGWSLGVGEVLTYARDFGTADLRALVLVDAFLSDPDKATVERLRGFFAWLKTMQTDRRKWTEDFVRNMYAKPQPEAYVSALQRRRCARPLTALSRLSATWWRRRTGARRRRRLTGPFCSFARPRQRPQPNCSSRCCP